MKPSTWIALGGGMLLLLTARGARADGLPHGSSRARARVLAIAQHEVDIGIVENPRGSNTSTTPEGGIAKYSPGASPAKWCVRFVKWVLRQAARHARIEGLEALGDSGSVADTLRRAREGGRFWPAGTARAPMPGDLYVTADEGHLGIVRKSDGRPGERSIDTTDGNSRDAVRNTTRAESSLLGYIDPY